MDNQNDISKIYPQDLLEAVAMQRPHLFLLPLDDEKAKKKGCITWTQPHHLSYPRLLFSRAAVRRRFGRRACWNVARCLPLLRSGCGPDPWMG